MKYRESVADLKTTLSDPDLDLTPKEALMHVYHWYMYWSSIFKVEKASRTAEKHLKFFNEACTVYRFRKEMQKL